MRKSDLILILSILLIVIVVSIIYWINNNISHFSSENYIQELLKNEIPDDKFNIIEKVEEGNVYSSYGGIFRVRFRKKGAFYNKFKIMSEKYNDSFILYLEYDNGKVKTDLSEKYLTLELKKRIKEYFNNRDLDTIFSFYVGSIDASIVENSNYLYSEDELYDLSTKCRLLSNELQSLVKSKLDDKGFSLNEYKIIINEENYIEISQINYNSCCAIIHTGDIEKRIELYKD